MKTRDQEFPINPAEEPTPGIAEKRHTFINAMAEGESEFWEPSELRSFQLARLRELCAFARRRIPFYRYRLPKKLTWESFAEIPLLTRREVQVFDLTIPELASVDGPPAFVASSGSTGTPVRVARSGFASRMWREVEERAERWNRPHRHGATVAIRFGHPGLTDEEAHEMRTTGLGFVDETGETGPVWLIDDRCTPAEWAAFIADRKPMYLLCTPSVFGLLLAHYVKHGGAPSGIHSVWTGSESLGNSRDLAAEILGARVVDCYSNAEAGHLALQCPESNGYHVQAETVLVEVLRADGKPCKRGEVGQVIITPLCNWATPLIRYRVGDEAEVGSLPCLCGRTLPKLRRILGRTYNYLETASGERRRIDTGFYAICRIVSVQGFRIVQRAIDAVDVELVMVRDPDEAEEKEIRRLCTECFGEEFRVSLVRVPELPRHGVMGKRQIFSSEMGSPSGEENTRGEETG